jgi:hypothetical protein
MTTPTSEPKPETNAREAAWARPVDRLKVGDLGPGAMNLNVDGKKLSRSARRC